MPQLWVSPEDLDDSSDYARALEACRTATYLLWGMSGRRYHGSSTVTEHYTCPSYVDQTIVPTLVNGDIINRRVSKLPARGDVVVDYVRLRMRPVLSVHTVISRGQTLDPSEYTLYNRAVLRSSQIDPCDVTVTYTYGASPPPAGKYAARVLANEFVKLWAGESCALPERVTSVSRQGVSYTFLDSQDFISELRTGIYAVDVFLKVANPDGARRPARIFSPDIPRAHRQSAPIAVSRKSAWDVSITADTASIWSVTLTPQTYEVFSNDADWALLVRVSSLGGTPLFDATATLVASTLQVSVSQVQAEQITALGGAIWDLYAQSTANPDTVLYMLAGNISITGA